MFIVTDIFSYVMDKRFKKVVCNLTTGLMIKAQDSNESVGRIPLSDVIVKVLDTDDMIEEVYNLVTFCDIISNNYLNNNELITQFIGLDCSLQLNKRDKSKGFVSLISIETFSEYYLKYIVKLKLAGYSIDDRGTLLSYNKSMLKDDTLVIPKGVRYIGKEFTNSLRHYRGKLKSIIAPDSIEQLDLYRFNLDLGITFFEVKNVHSFRLPLQIHSTHKDDKIFISCRDECNIAKTIVQKDLASVQIDTPSKIVLFQNGFTIRKRK